MCTQETRSWRALVTFQCSLQAHGSSPPTAFARPKKVLMPVRFGIACEHRTWVMGDVRSSGFAVVSFIPTVREITHTPARRDFSSFRSPSSTQSFPCCVHGGIENDIYAWISIACYSSIFPLCFEKAPVVARKMQLLGAAARETTTGERENVREPTSSRRVCTNILCANIKRLLSTAPRTGCV